MCANDLMKMEGGRWGLVIVASAFFIQVFAFGASSAIGVYNIEFLDYFDNDSVGVSLIASINLAVFLGAGPVASFLMTKMSYRKIAFVGSTLVVLGIFLMPFLPYIPAFCICFGLLTGLGSCLVYLPSHVLSGLYYDRHRSLATGVATSGSGLGGAIMPIVAGYLIQHFGWQGSLIMLAGIKLHLFVCAAVLRKPPTAAKVLPKAVESEALLANGAEADGRSGAQPEISMNETVLENNSETHLRSLPDQESGEFPNVENGSTSVETEVCKRAEGSITHVQNGVKSPVTEVIKLEEKKVLHHIYLFTDVGFTVYFISNFFWNISYALLMAFGAEYVTERGLNLLDAAWVASIGGFGCFLGGLVGGLLGNLLQQHRMALYVAATILFGVCTALIPSGSTYGEFVAIFFCAELMFGEVLGLLVVVLTDLIGPLSLGDGMGYLMLSNGLGCFVGPAVTGYIRQATGSYDAAFYFGGACSVTAGISMATIPLVHTFWAKTEKHQQLEI